MRAGFGNHGIQVCFSVALGFGVGLGDGVVVEVEPGSPFFTVITTWFSSSAVTEMHFSPSHSSALTRGIPIRVMVRVSAMSRGIGRN